MTEEEYCHEMLTQLRKSYERDAQPYVDRLAAIKALETPVMTVTLAQAYQLGFTFDGPKACP